MRDVLLFLVRFEEDEFSPDPLDTEKRVFHPFFLLSGGGSVLLLDIDEEGGGFLPVGVSERERIFLGSSLLADDGTTSMERLSGVTGRFLLLPGGVL